MLGRAGSRCWLCCAGLALDYPAMSGVDTPPCCTARPGWQAAMIKLMQQEEQRRLAEAGGVADEA